MNYKQLMFVTIYSGIWAGSAVSAYFIINKITDKIEDYLRKKYLE